MRTELKNEPCTRILRPVEFLDRAGKPIMTDVKLPYYAVIIAPPVQTVGSPRILRMSQLSVESTRSFESTIPRLRSFALPLAFAGLADASANTGDSLSSEQSIGLLLLPIVFSVALYLMLQRFAEFLLRPTITVREVAFQTAYLACAIFSVSTWFKLFG